MSKVTCTRRLTFCAGHRVMGHENKCAHLHGHNYVVEIEAEAELDSVGRVIDFSVLKEKIGGWLEREWDHGFVLNEQDAEAIERVRTFAPFPPGNPNALKAQKLYLMSDNPTAENMARYLLHQICPALLAGTGVVVCRVVIHETENCKAEARL